MVTKNLYCIVGASGTGKTTLANAIEKDLGLKQVQSYTTRPPRHENEEGHTFISNEEFKGLKDLVAYTKFDGYEYGVTRDMLEDCSLYVVDVEGVKTLKRLYKERPIVVIGLSDKEHVRALRMFSRGDSVEKVRDRIVNDRIMFADFDKVFDAVFAGLNMAEIICLAIEKIKIEER